MSFLQGHPSSDSHSRRLKSALVHHQRLTTCRLLRMALETLVIIPLKRLRKHLQGRARTLDENRIHCPLCRLSQRMQKTITGLSSSSLFVLMPGKELLPVPIFLVDKCTGYRQIPCLIICSVHAANLA